MHPVIHPSVRQHAIRLNQDKVRVRALTELIKMIPNVQGGVDNIESLPKFRDFALPSVGLKFFKDFER